MSTSSTQQRKPIVESLPSKVVSTSVATSASKEAKEDADIARLREFDLDTKFGPCIGISRMQRWERAERNGLEPPADVKDLIERYPKEQGSLWSEVKAL